MEQYSFAEIDSYISEFKMSESIKKYLITGELPKKKQTLITNDSASIHNNNNYLYDYEPASFGNYDKNHNTNSFTKVSELGRSPTLTFGSRLAPNSFDIANSIEKCKQLEKHIKQCELDENIDNQCPVCFIPISSANYVLPNCGHKMCVSCFIGNVKYNKHTGDCCAMCRKKYIST